MISLLLIMFCLFLLVWCLLVCESGAEVGIGKEKVCVCVCVYVNVMGGEKGWG